MVWTKRLEYWYENHKRDLPFRDIEDPYLIWVSEIMLQQTTVQTVIPYFNRFKELYPTVKDFASSTLEDAYKVWEGLGYYRRVKHMHETANMIVDNYNGVFPHTYKELISLKGIGPYTASAIMAFAYHEPYSAIDGNALRVLSRLNDSHDNIALNTTVRKITEYANQFVSTIDAAVFNQGLMDLANAICKPKQPLCSKCPLNDDCKAYKHHTESLLPINIKTLTKKEISYITGYITYQDKVLLIKNDEGLLENMYGMIQVECDSPFTYIEELKDKYDLDIEPVSYIKDFKHVFTHRIWCMHVYHFIIKEPNNNLYNKEETKELPIPTAHKKILQFLQR